MHSLQPLFKPWSRPSAKARPSIQAFHSLRNPILPLSSSPYVLRCIRAEIRCSARVQCYATFTTTHSIIISISPGICCSCLTSRRISTTPMLPPRSCSTAPLCNWVYVHFALALSKKRSLSSWTYFPLSVSKNYSPRESITHDMAWFHPNKRRQSAFGRCHFICTSIRSC